MITTDTYVTLVFMILIGLFFSNCISFKDIKNKKNILLMLIAIFLLITATVIYQFDKAKSIPLSAYEHIQQLFVSGDAGKMQIICIPVLVFFNIVTYINFTKIFKKEIPTLGIKLYKLIRNIIISFIIAYLLISVNFTIWFIKEIFNSNLNNFVRGFVYGLFWVPLLTTEISLIKQILLKIANILEQK